MQHILLELFLWRDVCLYLFKCAFFLSYFPRHCILRANYHVKNSKDWERNGERARKLKVIRIKTLVDVQMYIDIDMFI